MPIPRLGADPGPPLLALAPGPEDAEAEGEDPMAPPEGEEGEEGSPVPARSPSARMSSTRSARACRAGGLFRRTAGPGAGQARPHESTRRAAGTPVYRPNGEFQEVREWESQTSPAGYKAPRVVGVRRSVGLQNGDELPGDDADAIILVMKIRLAAAAAVLWQPLPRAPAPGSSTSPRDARHRDAERRGDRQRCRRQLQQRQQRPARTSPRDLRRAGGHDRQAVRAEGQFRRGHRHLGDAAGTSPSSTSQRPATRTATPRRRPRPAVKTGTTCVFTATFSKGTFAYVPEAARASSPGCPAPARTW